MPTAAADLRIDDLDVTSEQQLRSFWEVEQAAQRADRDEPILRGYDHFVASATDPSEYEAHVWLIGRHGDEIVGVAELELPATENTHLGEVEINVRPSARRAGVGRALHAEIVRRARRAGRTTLAGEVMAPAESGSAAVAFASTLGYRSVQVEHHLGLPLPVPPELLAAFGDTDPDYQIVTWEGACPDALRPAYLAMRNQMNADVPTGELDHEPVVLDDARLAAQEERTATSYLTLVAAARQRSTGALTGYSLLLLPRSDETLVHQDDTLVMPSHRGHHLGLALKRANLERLAAEHPTRRHLDTWTDPQNLPMRRANERIGFAVLEVMHEMELALA